MPAVVIVLGALVSLIVGAAVAASVIADAHMLVDAGGLWMLGLYLIVPALVGVDALLRR